MSEHTCQCRLSQENAELRARVREVEAGVESMIARMEAAWDAGWKREPWRISAAQHFQNAIAAARPLPPPVLPRTMTADIRQFDGVTLMNAADRELVEKFIAPSSKERGFLVRYEATVKQREWAITLLRSALENWGRHHPHCEGDAEKRCNCGLNAILAETALVVPNGPATPRETR